MLREEYKACFDEIKGSEKLLEKILSNAENVQSTKNIRHIKLVKFTKYAGAVAAAFAVFVSSSFLYNNGLFEHNDYTEDKLAEGVSISVSDGKEPETDSVKKKAYEATGGKAEEKSLEKTKEKSEEKTKPKGSTVDNSVSNEEITENIVGDIASEEKIEEKTEEKSKERITDKSKNENQTTEKSSDEEYGIAAYSVSEEEATAYDEAGVTSAAGTSVSRMSGGASAQAKAKAAVGVERAEEKFKMLNIFKEGILNNPEHLYETGVYEKEIYIYTNEDKTKKIEIAYITTDTEPNTDEGELLLETDGGYISVKAENISADYLKAIVSTLSE